MKLFYETKNLILKVLDSSYANIVLNYHIKNKFFLEEWEPLRDESFYTLRFQEKLLEKDMDSLKSGTALRLWIFKKDNETNPIGCIAFSNIVRGAFLSCHLGYKLDMDEVNKGYITEAIKKGIDIMFNNYGLHRIEANIMPKNKPSLRIVEKLGFYNEGLARKYLKINGVWEDHIHMVLLNDNL